MTWRLGTLSSSCFGALKSFLATRTPSRTEISINEKAVKVQDQIGHTLEEVFVDGTPVLFRDNHAGLAVLSMQKLRVSDFWLLRETISQIVKTSSESH